MSESQQHATTPSAPSAAPARINKVRLRNYKSIAFCEVELEPLTILVGRNGSGKSNFVDALAFLREAQFSLPDAVRMRGMQSVLCKATRAQEFSIEVEASEGRHDTREENKFRYSLTVRFADEYTICPPREHYSRRDAQGSLLHAFETRDGQIRRFSDGAWNDWSASPLPEHARLVPIVLYTLFGVPSPRFPHSMVRYNFIPEFMRLPRRAPRLDWLDRDGGNIASVLAATKDHQPAAFDRVADYLEAITGSVRLEGIVAYGPYETVQFSMNGGEPRLMFDAFEMSDGTLRALGALTAAFQDSKALGRPTMVAIEEPETSLHPGALRALVDALDEATVGTQVLLTTHSAELLDNPTICPENLRVVRLVEGRTIIGRVDAASVDIVKKHLDTLGGLERQDQLELDALDVKRQQELANAAPEPRP